jgi:hypothetical protein
MAIPKITGAQRDFSYGEIDEALKRADEHPARKAGLRQMLNARILNSGTVQNRPGRSALFPVSNACSRIDEFTIASGSIFKIAFGAGRIQIINSVGAIVQSFTLQGNGAALPWATSADIQKIVYAIFNLTIAITFGHAMRPQIITFDGVATWTIADYTEAIAAGGQKRTPFYRLSPQNVTMLPSAITGTITVQFSSPIVVAGMVGTRVRFAGRQILLGTVIDASNMNATVIEPLPEAQALTVSGAVGSFNIGDVVEGATSGAQGIVTSSPNIQVIQVIIVFAIGQAVTGGTSGATGIVTARSPGFGDLYTIFLSSGTAFILGETVNGGGNVAYAGPTNLVVQLIQADTNVNSFSASEVVAGPSASCTTTAVAIASPSPQAITVWDDEIINAFRGYPASCFVDQFRLGFCDFLAIPGGIAWSAINSPTDLYVAAATPDNAIFEIAPDKVRVRYVVPGPESSEFVFCDQKLYYIPISPANPLAPGSVQFQLLSDDGAAAVQPRKAQEVLLYVNAGGNAVMAVVATGAYYRPFNTRQLSEFHSHLFNNIQCIAAPNADGTFLERYVYVLNGDGSIAIGKYAGKEIVSDAAAPRIGWGPWSGAGTVSWIAAWNADVLFTTSYFGVPVCEILDDTQYLDCALPVNSLPAAFAPPGGKGPLWFIPNQSVTLIDQGTRAMGTYQIDANGFIVPQFNGGENLAIASLVAGQPWTAVIEPFCPDASPGNSVHQRMFKRRVSRFAVYVINSTGFLMARLFSGPVTPYSQANNIALGTVMNQRRITAFNIGDNPTLPPPLREEAQRWRPIGRSFDPRVAIIKDTPGTLLIPEIGMEASV